MGKRITILLICSLLAFAGCSGIKMSADYRRTVESQAILVTELDERCQSGDPNACAEGLHEAAKTLNMIVDAMYGRP